MKKRKKYLEILTIIFFFTVGFVFTGCGKNSEKIDYVEETATIETAEDTIEAEQNAESSDFDFDLAFKNIEIDGHHVEFPFSLNDLGDDFDIEYLTEMGGGKYCAGLMYKDNEIASVFLDCQGEKSVTRDTKTYGFSIRERNGKIVYVNGINCGNSIEEAEKKFIGIQKIVENKGGEELAKTENDDKVFLILYDENEIISEISFWIGDWR